MAIYKNKDIETNINERGAELGNINVNFYTEDNGTASIRIKIKNQQGVPINFNNTDMLPRLDLYAQDGSIFTNEHVDIILAEEGLIQYRISDYAIRHEGKMDCKLFLENGTESVHVANFYFVIKDSGITGAIGKEIKVEVLEDMVRNIMTDNAMGLLDDEYKEKINQDVVEYVSSNPEKYKGPKGDTGANGIKGEKGDKGDKGEPLKYSDLTSQQKEELKSNITDQAVTDFVLEDGTITNTKLADTTITNIKLNDNYASVKMLDNGTDILSLTKDGLYLKQNGNTSINLPVELGDGSTTTLFISVKAFNPNFRYIEVIDTVNTVKTYSNFIRLGSPRGWRINTEDTEIKKYALDTVNDKLQYNAQVFEKYSDGLIPNLNLLAANAVQEIKIEGLDPELPLKLWILSRNYANGSTNWNYRIMIAQKKDGVWSSVIDTGTGFTVTEASKGSTLVKYQNGIIKLQARINYNVLPQGGRVLDHDTLAEDPYFIIRPKNVSLTDDTIPDVEVYDQSLNTTDSVKFASIKADSIEVGGELKTGTLETPPTGLVKGDMWLDTTDSTTHPVLRVMA